MTAPDDDPLDPAAEEQYLGGVEEDLTADLDDDDDVYLDSLEDAADDDPIDPDEIPQL